MPILQQYVCGIGSNFWKPIREATNIMTKLNLPFFIIKLLHLTIEKFIIFTRGIINYFFLYVVVYVLEAIYWLNMKNVVKFN